MWFTYSERKVVELFVNIGDLDQTLYSAASYLGLHCLPVTLLGVSRLQWVSASQYEKKTVLTFCVINIVQFL